MSHIEQNNIQIKWLSLQDKYLHISLFIMSDSLNLRWWNTKFITYFPVLKLKMIFKSHQMKRYFKKSQWLGVPGCSVLSNVTYSKTGWSYFEGIRDRGFLAVRTIFPVSNLHFLLHVLQSFFRYHTSETSLRLYMHHSSLLRKLTRSEH